LGRKSPDDAMRESGMDEQHHGNGHQAAGNKTVPLTCSAHAIMQGRGASGQRADGTQSLRGEMQLSRLSPATCSAIDWAAGHVVRRQP